MARQLQNPEHSYRKRPPSARREELRALACQMFAEKGYATATLGDIAKAAGIQHSSLYHHFPTKDDILVETLDAFWRDLLAAYREVLGDDVDTRTGLDGLVRVAFEFLTRRNNEVRILYNDWVKLQRMDQYRSSREFSAEAEDIWLSVLRRGMADGTFRSDLDEVVYYRTLLGAILSVVRWYRPDGPLDAAGLTAKFTDLFLGGLKDPARR